MARARPVENALDLLGRRWALRLIWELRRSTLSFSELRERTGISPSVLSARLGELVEAGVVGAGRRPALPAERPRAASWPGSSTSSIDGPSRQGYPRGVSSPELSVVCRSCGEEVSPYVTECPYCGTRLRKRAPKLELRGDELTPRESRRVAAPPGARAADGADRRAPLRRDRGDPRSPRCSSSSAWRARRSTPTTSAASSVRCGGDWWRYFAAPFVYPDIGYLFVASVGIAIFGIPVEQRLGTISTVDPDRRLRRARHAGRRWRRDRLRQQ